MYLCSMRRSILLTFLFLIIGLNSACRREITLQDVSHLNGYWEIEFVELADGTKKDYTINETIDHFQIKGDQGVRRKLRPAFDGRYQTSGHVEKVFVKFSDSGAQLQYQTEFDKWSEDLIALDSNQLVIRNKQLTYHYKRPIAFSLK